jgi:ubiquinone/menaquinone biosynthesis C-methylase UbiE
MLALQYKHINALINRYGPKKKGSTQIRSRRRRSLDMAGPGEEENVYFIDPENAAEMARLTDQDRIVTEAMGGLFPADLDLTGVHRILDVACGPGGWAQEVAFHHPTMAVVGFDISKAMIDYANAQAHVQGLENVSFQVMDVQKPLNFPDASFDFVNSRFITFLPAAAWHQLIHEIGRITRPGGTIRLTETEWWNTSNSSALEELNTLICRSIQQQGGFSTSGRFTGVLPLLGQFLQDAGCTSIRHQSYVIDYSYGSPAYESFRRDAQVLFKLVQPQMKASGLATQEELDKLYEQMLIDMMQPSFRALMLVVSALGKKAA